MRFARPLLLAIGYHALAPLLSFADVQITAFNDLTFGTWGASGDMVQTDDLCVYNSFDDNYKITATGSGGSFQMTSGGDNLSYEVRFRQGGGSYVQLTHNSSSSFTNANTTSATCSGGTNSTLQVTVRDTALAAARPGNYSGVLTLLLEPGP